MGLGGDDSWNPRTHKEYLLDKRNYIFSYRLSPVTNSNLKVVSESVTNLPVLCAPVIEINCNNDDGSDKVEIKTTTPNAKIFYTLDGTIPSENSNLYTGFFYKKADTVVKACAIKPGYFKSVISQSDFD